MSDNQQSGFGVKEYFGIKILKDGTWLHEGQPIKRMSLVKLLSTVLKRDNEGFYWLQTPVEKGQIEVEDVPFVAVELKSQGTGINRQISFRTNIDDWVTVDFHHALSVHSNTKTSEIFPYVMIRDGLEAKLLRPVYYHLVDLCEENPEKQGEMGVWSCGQFYPIGNVS